MSTATSPPATTTPASRASSLTGSIGGPCPQREQAHRCPQARQPEPPARVTDRKVEECSQATTRRTPPNSAAALRRVPLPATQRPTESPRRRNHNFTRPPRPAGRADQTAPSLAPAAPRPRRRRARCGNRREPGRRQPTPGQTAPRRLVTILPRECNRCGWGLDSAGRWDLGRTEVTNLWRLGCPWGVQVQQIRSRSRPSRGGERLCLLAG